MATFENSITARMKDAVPSVILIGTTMSGPSIGFVLSNGVELWPKYIRDVSLFTFPPTDFRLKVTNPASVESTRACVYSR